VASPHALAAIAFTRAPPSSRQSITPSWTVQVTYAAIASSHSVMPTRKPVRCTV
jgi:hypothetical protein